MGLSFVEATVTGKKGKKVTVKFLVDSGAIYSLLPEKDWKAIGLKPKRTMTFTLADGTEIKRGISECRIAMDGRENRAQRIGQLPAEGVLELGVAPDGKEVRSDFERAAPRAISGLQRSLG